MVLKSIAAEFICAVGCCVLCCLYEHSVILLSTSNRNILELGTLLDKQSATYMVLLCLTSVTTQL